MSVDSVQVLYERGLYVQAYRRALEEWGPVEGWARSPCRVLAGRLAFNLGNARAGLAWHLAVGRSRSDTES